MKNLEIYQRIIGEICDFYGKRRIKNWCLHGGCYWLALVLHQYIYDSEIVINYSLQHCGCRFDRGVYDITGRICAKGFHEATQRDHAYMKKNFIPNFDTEAVKRHLEERLGLPVRHREKDFD